MKKKTKNEDEPKIRRRKITLQNVLNAHDRANRKQTRWLKQTARQEVQLQLSALLDCMEDAEDVKWKFCLMDSNSDLADAIKEEFTVRGFDVDYSTENRANFNFVVCGWTKKNSG